jgi:DNA-binding NarL/FixJ family response regulator
VAVLVATGLTNADIAAWLVAVPGTVSDRVERILRKLRVSRRTQIASWVVQRGLRMPDAAPTP